MQHGGQRRTPPPESPLPGSSRLPLERRGLLPWHESSPGLPRTHSRNRGRHRFAVSVMVWSLSQHHSEPLNFRSDLGRWWPGTQYLSSDVSIAFEGSGNHETHPEDRLDLDPSPTLLLRDSCLTRHDRSGKHLPRNFTGVLLFGFSYRRSLVPDQTPAETCSLEEPVTFPLKL